MHLVYFDHHQDHKMHKQLRMMMCIRACGNIGTTFEALKQHSTATTYHEQVRDHILRKLGWENILCLFLGEQSTEGNGFILIFLIAAAERGYSDQ